MKWKIIPLVILLICFVYPMNFLVRYGEMFGKGSDVVSNVAYGMTMFQGVHQANWGVPKPNALTSQPSADGQHRQRCNSLFSHGCTCGSQRRYTRSALMY